MGGGGQRQGHNRVLLLAPHAQRQGHDRAHQIGARILEGGVPGHPYAARRRVDPETGAVGVLDSMAVRVARHDDLASAVVYRMEQYGIMAMPVLGDDGEVAGVVHLHDLMRAGAA